MAPLRLSLAHLIVLDAHPLELIDAAAAGGFNSVGLRIVAPMPTDRMVPVIGDEAPTRQIERMLADTGIGHPGRRSDLAYPGQRCPLVYSGLRDGRPARRMSSADGWQRPRRGARQQERRGPGGQGDQRVGRRPRPKIRDHDARQSEQCRRRQGLGAESSRHGRLRGHRPTYWGAMVVSMSETRHAEVPNFTGAAAAAITQQGNPSVIRTNTTQAQTMPKVARYIRDGPKAKTVDLIWINSDFGKGGATSSSRPPRRSGSKCVLTSRPTRVRWTSLAR
jgi:hypothetical protein